MVMKAIMVMTGGDRRPFTIKRRFRPRPLSPPPLDNPVFSDASGSHGNYFKQPTNEIESGSSYIYLFQHSRCRSLDELSLGSQNYPTSRKALSSVGV